MNITLKRPVLDKLKGKGIKAVDEHLRYNSYSNDASLKMDVGTMTEEEFKKVIPVLELDKVANRNALDVIDFFKKAKANPSNAKPRTLEQFATLLAQYISKVKGYRVYEQTEEDGRYRAYVCTGTSYHPPQRKREAYVQLAAAYYYRGHVKTQTWTFMKRDVRKKTVSEILDDAGLIPATDKLDAEQEVAVKRFMTLKGLSAGHQMWGTGFAKSAGKSGWGYSRMSLDVDGKPTRVVLDCLVEGSNGRDDAEGSEAPIIDGTFWNDYGRSAQKSEEELENDDGDLEGEEAEKIDASMLQVPLVPEVLVFNLEKHEQAWAHVGCLTDYEYDPTMGEKLVLPDFQKELIEVLVSRDRAEMQDIVRGKAGGSIVLCSGAPGTGKTLTAEVFAEAIRKPLYIVASSQLGTTPESLEQEMKTCLARATRLQAIMLIDEADVFIHERGDDMIQNAVVGVFLRVLEYFQGTMFLTTNRATIVDDAIVSRCTAQVKYTVPGKEGLLRIFKNLVAVSGLKVQDSELKKFTDKHPGLSGRDAKGLLKLANMVSVRKKEPITAKMLEMVSQFKPTAEAPMGSEAWGDTQKGDK